MNLLRERNHWAVVIEVSNNDSEGRRASQSWGSPVCCCDYKPECKHIYIYTVSARVFTPMQFCGDWMYEMTHLVSVQISLSMMAAVVMLPVSGSILNKPLMDDDLRE